MRIRTLERFRYWYENYLARGNQPASEAPAKTQLERIKLQMQELALGFNQETIHLQFHPQIEHRRDNPVVDCHNRHIGRE